MSILIIEDDEEMSSLLQDFLKTDGFDTASVSSGPEAFGELEKKSFELVITDIRMPGLTGLDIIPGIKKLQPELPIIVITAFGSETVRSRALERGASGYLEKPIHFNELRILIEKEISRKKLEA